MSGTYSVAIRTLGQAGEKFRREIESLHRQTIAPERIVVYIAEGYARPDWQVGKEEYVYIKKGMLAQRALTYDDIDSEYILFLDDDVELGIDSAEKMILALENNSADVIVADTFKNQKMSVLSKFKAAVLNWAVPRRDDGWAFKIGKSTSFSYNNHPASAVCPSQSGSGPASLWKKKSFLAIRVSDELWVDQFFGYGEDLLYFYKAYVNGLKLMVQYNADCTHLDGGTGSVRYRNNPKKLYNRSFASYVIWHRLFYAGGQFSTFQRFCNSVPFVTKWTWLGLIHCALSLKSLSIKPLKYYIQGTNAGRKYVRSAEYKSLPDFYLK